MREMFKAVACIYVISVIQLCQVLNRKRGLSFLSLLFDYSFCQIGSTFLCYLKLNELERLVCLQSFVI